MKKLYFSFAFFIIVCLLSACNVDDETSVYTDLSSSVAQNSNTQEVSFSGKLRCVRPAYGDGDNSGFYSTREASLGGINLYYTDYETKQQVVLCSRPECKHDDEACTGWVETFYNHPIPIVQQDKLVLVYPGNAAYLDEFGDKALAYIEIRERNGTNATRLLTFEANEQIETYKMAVDERYLYVLQKKVSENDGITTENNMIAVDLETGKTEIVCELETEETNTWFFVGTADNQLIIKRIFMPEEMLEATDTEELMKSQTHELLAVNRSGSKKGVIKSWKQGEYYEAALNNKLFCVSNGGSLLHIEVKNKEETVLIETLENMTTETVDFIVYSGDYLIFDVYVSGLVPGETAINRYAVDIYNGDLYPVNLTQTFGGVTEPVTIVGETDAVFYVVKGLEEKQVIRQDPTGNATNETALFEMYALIDKTDYINSKPSYETITSNYAID